MDHHNYDSKRLLSCCTPKIAKAIDSVWKKGEQLAVEAIPEEALAPVLMMAAWGRRVDIEIVDDYPELLERMRQALKEGVHHPDLFFASCIVILDERGEEPTIGAFEQINIPNIFEDYFGEQEVREDEPAPPVEEAEEQEEPPEETPPPKKRRRK